MRIINQSYSIHELGKRANQEDSIWPDVLSASSDLYILCDGMGGHEHGEVASQTVCEVMSQYVREHCSADGIFGKDDFEAALAAAYDALDSKDKDDSAKKMGTTLTFVKFHAGGCFVAHIGDSRIYHVRPSAEGDKKILFVTRDHSLVNDLVTLGELTPDEAKTSKQKNIITRAVQPHQERRAKADIVNITDIREGDYFYMCSDGMLEVSEDSEIANIFSMDNSDEDKVRIFIGATSENRDNHSAFLIKVTSVVNDDVKPDSVETDNSRKEAQLGKANNKVGGTSKHTAKPVSGKQKSGSSGMVLYALAALLFIVVVLYLLKIIQLPIGR